MKRHCTFDSNPPGAGATGARFFSRARHLRTITVVKSLLLALFMPALCLGAAPTKDVLYVTQVPIPDEIFTHTVAEARLSIASTMQSPLADPTHAGRGGALWIRYASGGVPRNLTAAAGYGLPVDANGNAVGFQGANGIAVHRPFMHWSGTKAIFAMVVGAPTSAADTTVFYWQLYEITNFGSGQTPVISHVAGQPANYNNYEACYDTQDRIIFVSDAPRAMQTHLYPQLDEYVNAPVNTGLWRLDPAHGNELKHIIHAPSGAFTPFIDSAGRVMFIQWDHLSRDVSATYDRPPDGAAGETWAQTFNGNGTFASELPGAVFTRGTPANYASFNNYPEPRNFDKTALNALVNVNGNAMNQFFPWECHEDGSSHEIINHVGRHEFGGSTLRPSFNDDPNLVLPSFPAPTAVHMLHLTESPTTGGTFYAVSPPEFGTHMAGPILRFNGGMGVNPENMAITYVTPNVNVPNPALQSPLTNAVDIYRNPTPLSDGGLLAVHASVKQHDSNIGADAQHPKSRYDFKLRMLMASSGTMVPDGSITLVTQHNVAITYYADGVLMTYSGAPLWELDPVEVYVPPTKPNQLTAAIASVEQTVFDEEKVHGPTFQADLRSRGMAMVVNRDSSRRDSADKQQPYNLKVAWSNTQSLGTSGKVYDIGWVQIFQADAIRGFTHSANVNAPPQPGRRTMPVPLHDSLAEMPVVPGAPPGAVKIADDGSWAAILPAGRALTWHLLDGAGAKSQTKERYWVDFAPGEVRTCAVCHGVNTHDQTGALGVPQTKPAALRPVLQFWRTNHPPGVVQHSAAAASVRKDAPSALLTLTRTAGSTGPVSVHYATADGSALAGTDYTAASGNVTWADGDTAAKTITIPLLHPATVGPTKALTVNLSGAQYADLGGTTAATLSLTEPPLQAWLYGKFGPTANSTDGPGVDSDFDGLPNLVEFLLASDPKLPTPVPVVARNGGNVTFTYPRRSDYASANVTTAVEWVTSLTGTWSGAGVSEQILDDDGTLQHVQATIPTGGAGQFFVRLRVVGQ